jgi:hypothetical protein
MLAPLFEFDVNALKMQAACDAFRLNPGVQDMKKQFMSEQLNELLTNLTGESRIQLDPKAQ